MSFLIAARMSRTWQRAWGELCDKGHRYLTIVLDIGTGAVVFVGDGKGACALELFWERPGRERVKKIKAVV